MKRDLHVQLIKRYITESRIKTFEEVSSFTDEIGASLEEMETAIFEASQEHSLFTMNIPHIVLTDAMIHHAHKNILLRIKPRHVGVLALLVILGSISLHLMLHSTATTNTITPVSVTSIQSVKGLEPQQVYANQTPINATKVFSYPAMNIPLAYTGTPKKQVIGFFPYWMLSEYNNIDTTGYTSVNIFGITTDGNGNIITESNNGPDAGWEMWNNPQLTEFLTKLKRQNTKRIITIKTFNDEDIASLATSDTAQETLISNALQMVNTKNLDGINLDFEYTGNASSAVRTGFVRLVANLNTALHHQYPNSILTVDTYASAGADDNFFNVTALQSNVNALIVMGYDIHTPNGSAGPVAPFEGPGGLIGDMESYLQRVSPDKLILAVPYYGYDWQEGSNQNGSILSYAEVADLAKSNQVKWDDTSETPYLHYTINNTTHDVYFENTRSLGIKYDYINQKNLAGVGVWAMGYDGYSQDLTKLLFDKFGSQNF